MAWQNAQEYTSDRNYGIGTTVQLKHFVRDKIACELTIGVNINQIECDAIALLEGWSLVNRLRENAMHCNSCDGSWFACTENVTFSQKKKKNDVPANDGKQVA